MLQLFDTGARLTEGFGEAEGSELIVGQLLGASDGASDGIALGLLVSVGYTDGAREGVSEGTEVGPPVGSIEGSVEREGIAEGDELELGAVDGILSRSQRLSGGSAESSHTTSRIQL